MRSSRTVVIARGSAECDRQCRLSAVACLLSRCTSCIPAVYRRISIQVKTKRSGTWHARFPRDGAECPEDSGETSYWVFVDLGGEHPEYFIAPRWWVRNDIWQVASAYFSSY